MIVLLVTTLVMNLVRGFTAKAELHARMIPGYLATFRGRFPAHPLTRQLVEQGC